jgi:hypothetical protein
MGFSQKQDEESLSCNIAKQHFVTIRRHENGPAMALSYEDLRLAPRGESSVFTEAESLDAPGLVLPDSLNSGDVDEISNITSDQPTFLFYFDLRIEEQRLL